MKCPYCRVEFHPDWGRTMINLPRAPNPALGLLAARCPACSQITVKIGDAQPVGNHWTVVNDQMVMPRSAMRLKAPTEVPPEVAKPYNEACDVLPYSPMAAAALARRCLQTILHAHG